MLVNIFIGIGASLIASIIWFFFTQLYLVGARSQINLLLICLRTDNYLFEKALENKDYNLALDQVEDMMRKVENINFDIKTFTYTIKRTRGEWRLVKWATYKKGVGH